MNKSIQVQPGQTLSVNLVDSVFHEPVRIIVYGAVVRTGFLGRLILCLRVLFAPKTLLLGSVHINVANNRLDHSPFTIVHTNQQT